MLFPTEAQYRAWFERAGFEDVELAAVAPDGIATRGSKYAVAVSGRKAAAGASPLAPAGAPPRTSASRWTGGGGSVFAGRFALGSLAGSRVRARRLRALLRAALGPMTGRAIALPAARPLGALWRFSRPHTIVGTTVSIVALYVIAVATLPGLALGGGLWDLWWTLVAGLAVNVYSGGQHRRRAREARHRCGRRSRRRLGRGARSHGHDGGAARGSCDQGHGGISEDDGDGGRGGERDGCVGHDWHQANLGVPGIWLHRARRRPRLQSTGDDGAIIFRVVRFREKPNAELAETFVRDGNFRWNAGMFVWSVPTVLSEFNRHAPELANFISQLRAERFRGSTCEIALRSCRKSPSTTRSWKKPIAS